MTNLIRRDTILGSRRFSNYFWATVLLIGGIGFLLTGFSSFFRKKFLPFMESNELAFIPQGILISFYGVIAITLSIYLILIIIWDVGGGYNEFDKVNKLVRIVRKGFPGRNRQILLVYPISEIKSIKISIQDGINPKRMMFLCTKDQRQIPLNQVEEPRSLSEVEKQASEIAKFLDVNLEGI
jgi:Ycf4